MKLTIVSVYYRGNRAFCLVRCPYSPKGQALIPSWVIQDLLNELGVRPGDTYSVGA